MRLFVHLSNADLVEAIQGVEADNPDTFGLLVRFAENFLEGCQDTPERNSLLERMERQADDIVMYAVYREAALRFIEQM